MAVGVDEVEQESVRALEDRKMLIQKKMSEVENPPAAAVAADGTVQPRKGGLSYEARREELQKQLAELFPHLKNDELEVMEAITTKKELDDYIKAHGR